MLALLLLPDPAHAHAVDAGDKGYIQCTHGLRLVPFMYLGAKHMVSGYDHLLFLVGVIFFLYHARDVALYVTLFALGHSATLLLGVFLSVGVNPHLIDAIIGFSVVYKALDNIGVLRNWLGFQPSAAVSTAVFGLCHGLGLASKILEFDMGSDGLVPNLIAFNVGVEAGQLLALSAILIGMSYWRRTPSFARNAYVANVALMIAGIGLIAYQVIGYLTTTI
jgi:hypothetical protein